MPTNSPAWPHAPTHQLSGEGTFIVTAGTYQKQHFFRSAETLRQIHDGLLRYAKKYDWTLEAWAVFSNHYHFVAHSPDESSGGAESLSQFLSHFHTKSAIWLNDLDGAAGRKVWHNFWETRLTHQKSYLARLNYVHQNAVRHGLVGNAPEYPWCSAGWFERTATGAQVKTIYGFKTDQLKVLDEYEPVWEDGRPN